jgi:dTDP-4-amino-4,6-dideoxygalactose transaminase
VLDSGRLSYGPYSRRFEKQFSELHGCQYGVLSNSGTSSLQVALQTLKELHGWEDGDEIFVPAVTFVATVNVVLHNRLKPVLVDVEPDYYGLAVDDLPWPSGLIRAIIPVHLFGMPCDMTALTDWALDYDIPVIEDSCECMFATHHGKPAGSWGDIGCFSTYVAHLLTTGVGGIAITNNSDYAAKMRSLVNHGRDSIAYFSIDDDDNVSGEELREVVSRRFNFEAIGHSYRITELEAAIACAQLERWQEIIHLRKRNAEYLTGLLVNFRDRIQLPKYRPDTTSSWMMYPIVLREGDKWKLIHYLEERGIETRELMRLTDQPCYKRMWNPKDYPVADWLNRQGFYVGIHPNLDFEDMEYISDVFYDYFREN